MTSVFAFSVHFCPFWYRCYYPHTSRESVSPVCGIFSLRLLGLVLNLKLSLKMHKELFFKVPMDYYGNNKQETNMYMFFSLGF